MTTKRVEKLKDYVLRGNSSYFEQADPQEVGNFLTLETKSVKNNKRLRGTYPPVYRKALAYRTLFREVSPKINAHELIVGEPIRNCFPAYLFQEEHALFVNPTGSENPTNVVPDYNKVLTQGFLGIKMEAEEKLEQIKKLGNPQAMWFLKAVILCCESISDLANRYSIKAKQMVKEEPNACRKEELALLSLICERVPARPARSFHEALQGIWFTHMALRADDSFHIPLGRLDQILYPFHKKDIEKGVITKEKAEELLDCLWVKFNFIHSPRHYFEGDNGQAIVVGGQTREGEDATNDLSYMFVEASMRIKMIQPSLKVRIHEKIPPALIKKACELARMGTGSPLFCNDDVIIPSLVKVGYALEDARDYVTSACYELLLPGISNNRPNWGEVCFLRCLESTLNNGKSLLTNQKIGDDLGNLTDYCKFSDLMNNLKKQISREIKKAVNKCKGKRYAPAPLLSATMTDCVKNTKDVSEGGCRYNNIGAWGSALANTADALAAIKKLVFEEKKISTEELQDALKLNYENREDLRLTLINKVPKFGCDDDYVDLIAKEIAEYYSQEVLKYFTEDASRYLPSLASAWSYVFVGRKLGASPDGRKARESFAVNFSPAPGRDSKGPTAVIKSLTKIDLSNFPNCSPSDLKFSHSSLFGDKNLENFVSFVKAFTKLGGAQIQFNVVDSETLKKAQLEPDKYRSLIVRVWGFSAYFVTLTKEFQEHVIERYEHDGF